MFGIIKILAIIALIAVIIIYFGKIKHKETSIIVGLIICTIISAVISNAVLNIIPLPTDKVVVTATGEKNEDASSNEIILNNLLIGGEECEFKKPSEGKWFWKGKYYMWRNENDIRQPEGTTRSITIDMPYGCGRSVEFGLSKWNGIVEVTYGGDTKSYDLFKSEDMEETVLYAPIPDTESFSLYATKLLRVGLLVLFIVLLMAYPVYAVLKFDCECIKKWFSRNWDKFYYIAVALAGLIVTFIIGKGGTLWRDEVWNIGWIYSGSYPYLSFWLTLQTIWFKIMPYGQEYLLLLSEIWIAITVYVYGLIGAELKSKRLGVILATLGATSSTIIFQGSMEFRNYPMVFLGMALSVYFFIKKQKNIGNEKISTLLLYGLSLAIAMESHTFGLVAAGLMMIFDFVIVIVKKRYKNFIEFIFPAVYGVYWLFTSFASGVEIIQNKSWAASTPSVKAVIDFVYYLCGSNWINVALFIFGYIIVIGYLIYRIYKKQIDLKLDYASLVFVLLPVLFFAFNIIFTNTVIKGSLFNKRYFVSIVVFFEIFIGIAIDTLIQLVNKNQSAVKNLTSMALTLSVCVYMCIISWNSQSVDTRDGYHAIADYLMGQNDIYSPSTVTIVHGDTNINSGFEYYLSHKSERDSINHIDRYTDFTQYDTIYVVYPGYPYDEATYTDNGYKKVELNTSLLVCKYVRG